MVDQHPAENTSSTSTKTLAILNKLKIVKGYTWQSENGKKKKKIGDSSIEWFNRVNHTYMALFRRLQFDIIRGQSDSCLC